jgi:hypothetical protein
VLLRFAQQWIHQQGSLALQRARSRLERQQLASELERQLALIEALAPDAHRLQRECGQQLRCVRARGRCLQRVRVGLVIGRALRDARELRERVHVFGPSAQ